MNIQDDSAYGRWVIGAIAVVLGLALLVGACVVGATGGYLVARGQFNRALAEQSRVIPREVVPAVPVMPEQMPEMPIPAMPEDFEHMEGALLQEVTPGSPAALADLQAGDVITEVDGEPVTPEQSLADLIGQYEPGDEVTITLMRFSGPRQGQFQIRLELGENPDIAGQPYLGVRFVPMFFGED